MELSKDGLPVPPAHVPKSKWDIWYDYWRKIYLDQEEAERDEIRTERMLYGSGNGSEVEAD